MARSIYTIFDHDERGNYRLKDSMGIGMQQKFRLEKLWPISTTVHKELDVQEKGDICEVKDIIDDRTVNNKIEYKVRWSDKSKDSWVKETDFGTVEVKNEYWKRKFDEEA